ncbi:MAG: YqgE/AlgH family protein [Bacteroidetes bacterium]|nr:MAG: YqgE/AlgH family protein [Bacteroidota bacterium]
MDHADITPAPGVLLVAPPLLADPNFRRSVVLLCEHGEDGSFGLILNRPMAIQPAEVLDDFYGYDEPLSLGGPVEPNTLHYLHRHGDVIPGAIRVFDGVYWGGDFEAVRTLTASGGASTGDLRFFLGYAGWSPGQLDAEIDAGGWFLARAREAAIFPRDPDRLWRDVLRSMGREYALLANFPDDPRMN